MSDLLLRTLERDQSPEGQIAFLRASIRAGAEFKSPVAWLEVLRAPERDGYTIRHAWEPQTLDGFTSGRRRRDHGGLTLCSIGRKAKRRKRFYRHARAFRVAADNRMSPLWRHRLCERCERLVRSDWRCLRLVHVDLALVRQDMDWQP